MTKYLEEYFAAAEGRFDIYSTFIEKGTDLANKGHLCYIVSNKFFDSGGGEPLRQYLTQNKLLRQIVDFGQIQVFDGVTTYTCILSLSSDTDKFEYIETDDIVQSASKIQNMEKASMRADDFDNEPWVLTSPDEKKALNKLEQNGVALNSLVNYICQGVKSGDNDVFFPEIIKWGEETVEVQSPADEEIYTLERDVVKKLVRGSNIERYTSPDDELCVIYPYEENNEKTAILSESQLADSYPNTYRYFKNFEHRLSDRAESGQYDQWFCISRPREKHIFESPKLIVPDVCQKSEFIIDDSGGVYVSNTGYAIIPKENTKTNRRYLLAILNSTATWFYVYLTSAVLRGDFRRFLRSYIEPIPVPKVDENRNVEDLINSIDSIGSYKKIFMGNLLKKL
jgi:hypothetical protein